MSCFLVPLTEAIATSAYCQINKKSIEKSESALKRHVPALEKMLWGGSLMLMVDHAINGELSLSFPFFTALSTEGGFSALRGAIKKPSRGGAVFTNSLIFL